jgi:V/A-type H+-transporting ATPase subunit A
MIAPDRCTSAGRIIELLGPVVRARLVTPMALGEVGFIGEERLIGEVVAIAADVVTLQVYESTVGIAAGAPIFACGQPLSAELGPGLLGGIFDGLQRPLPALAAIDGDVLRRGRHPPALDRDRRWRFEPRARDGDAVTPGDLLGSVQETLAIAHRVLVPPGVAGRVAGMAGAGEYRVEDRIATVRAEGGEETAITLMSRWPARVPRPYRTRLALDVPLITGQRVLDTFFPVPLGGTVGMPGGFGTGKTVMQQQLCKRAQADVIVFVGCGERGNEMAEVLSILPTLTDPRTGRPLSERTVLIANTSDMPVAAREASIYMGVTIAEYYRDMGHHALLLADSTSRWAEALREISGRLGEMPAEEGYPPYLASRLAAFYERAGRVTGLGGLDGSVTLVGAVSPAGGDLTEPVTRHTGRHTLCFWTLDKAMAQARKFPAISLAGSYSDRAEQFAGWWERETGLAWGTLRREAMQLLEEADHLEQTARLIGTSNLPERQQLVLALAELFQDAFLRQAALGDDDEWCSPVRQVRLLHLLVHVARKGCARADTGVPARDILLLPALADVRRARSAVTDDALQRFDEILAAFDAQCEVLASSGAVPVAAGSA